MKFGHTLPFGGEDTLLAQSIDNLAVAPADAFPGTPSDDNLTGTSGNDTFDLTAGGNDTVHALGGDDQITMGATLTAADSIDGGDGNDTLFLNGDYSAGVTLGATTLVNVENLVLSVGHSYNITTADATVADGATLTIDGSQLGSHDTLTFDGSAEQTGFINVFAGAGNDTITTGQGSDYVDASAGGNDTINLGGDAGDPDQNGDAVYFGQAFTVNDSVNGGDPAVTSQNFVQLQGNYRITLKDTSFTDVGNLQFLSGLHLGNQSFSYYIVENDANVASGGVMQVLGTNLTATETLRFDGSAETDGSFLMYGGAGNDTFYGGAGDDFFRGAAGDDFIDGGGGKNRATFSDSHTGVTVNLATHVAQNTGDGMDTIKNIADVSGGSGNDTLTGDVNNNWLWGEGGNDTIVGNGGDDIIQVGTLTGTLGTDNADGGAGHDTIDFDENGGSYGGITFSLALQGTGQATGVDTVNAQNFENVNGSDFNDMLTGNTTGNVLYGGAGSDILSGGDGNDTLYGDKVLVPAESTGGGDGPTGVLDSDPGTGGDDALTGGAGNDILDGGEGDDTAIYSDATGSVTVNLTLTGAQNIGGGDGKDTLTSIENIIGSSFADKLTGDDHANVFTGNGGGDTVSGGGGDDTINLTGSGNVAITGGAGDDYIDMTGPGYLTTSSRVDGGADSDTLALSGDYSAGVIFGTSTVVNIETMTFAVGNDYKIKTADGTVAAGQEMKIDASDLGSSDTLNFNGSRETDGSFNISGGAGNDLIVGSLTGDTIRGALGADHIIESGGDNTLVYFGVAESTGLAHDLVSGFNAVNDQFLMSVTVNAVDAAVNAGQLRTAHFDTDLASAVGSGQLAAHDAVVFTANSGTLSGHTYLIVDANGVAGYQAGADFVIELSGASNLGSLNADNFSHIVT